MPAGNEKNVSRDACFISPGAARSQDDASGLQEAWAPPVDGRWRARPQV